MPPVYVDIHNGDNSRTYAQAQSPSTPWKTLSRAAQTGGAQDKQNGDAVRVGSGVYDESPAISGTQSNNSWVCDGYVRVIGTGSPQWTFDATTSSITLDGFEMRSDTWYAILNGTTNTLIRCKMYGRTPGGNGAFLGVAVGYTGPSVDPRIELCRIKAQDNGQPLNRGAIPIDANNASGIQLVRNSIKSERSCIQVWSGTPGAGLFSNVSFNIFVGKSGGTDGSIIIFGGAANAWAGDNNRYFDLDNAPPSPTIIDGDTLATFKGTVAPDEANSVEGDPMFGSHAHNRFSLRAGAPDLDVDGITALRGAVNRGTVRSYDDTPSRWGAEDPTFPDGNTGFVNSGVDDRVELKTDPGGNTRFSMTTVVPAGATVDSVDWEDEITIVAGAGDDRIIDRTAGGNPDTAGYGIEVNSGAATGSYTERERGRTIPATSGTNVHLELSLRSDRAGDA